MGFLSEFDFQRWEISLVNPLEQADYSNVHLRLFFAPYDMHRVSIHINYLFDGDILYRANEMFKDVTPEETLVLDKSKESLFLEWKKAIESIDEKIDEELLRLILRSRNLGKRGISPHRFFESSEDIYLKCWRHKDRPFYVFCKL